MEKSTIKNSIAGNPGKHIAGLQNDWWTEISPDLWNSHGAYLRDLSGIEYLDFCGFFSSAPIRYDHPKLRDPSFMESMAKMAIYRPSLGDFWITEMAEFINTLRAIATPSYLHHYFFIDGGALAVENALKAAFDWKVRLNMQKGKIKNDPQEERLPLGTKIIYFDSAFHGRTGYTLSLTHTNDPNKYKYFPKFDWFRIEAPFYRFDNAGNISNLEEAQKQEEKSISKMQSILEKEGDDIAAMLFEPIQCEGGDRYIPATFFIKARQLADQYDVLLIYDEVQTGFGTTGKMWGHEHFGDKALPDLIAFSKKSQTGGIMANYDKFSVIEDNVFGNKNTCRSRLNSTWGGNILDMMRCSLFLKIIQEENLLQNAKKIGAFLLDGLRNLCNRFNGLIHNPRGLGMLLAFDTLSPEAKSKTWQTLKDNQLLGLTCGERTIRFRPHLDLTMEEAEDALNRIEKGLSAL